MKTDDLYQIQVCEFWDYLKSDDSHLLEECEFSSPITRKPNVNVVTHENATLMKNIHKERNRQHAQKSRSNFKAHVETLIQTKEYLSQQVANTFKQNRILCREIGYHKMEVSKKKYSITFPVSSVSYSSNQH